MAEITCQICHRLNDSKAECCWYCNAILSDQAGNAEGENERNEKENEESAIRLTEGQSSEVVPGESDKIPTEEAIPDWLARIRKLREMEEELS